MPTLEEVRPEKHNPISRKSLTRKISRDFEVPVDSPQFQTIFCSTLMYLTGCCSAFQYQDLMRPVCVEHKSKFSAKEFRLGLVKSEYLSFRLKMFCLRLIKTASRTKATLEALRADYGIKKSDCKNILAALDSSPRFRIRLRLNARPFDPTTHLNLKVVHRALTEILPSIEPKFKSTVFKRLRFVCDSQNIEFTDFQSDLRLKVIQAFYKIMPTTMSYNHVVNYLKRVANNHAINLIYANTSKRAGRQVNLAKRGDAHDSFSLIVVSENQLKGTDSESTLNYESLHAVDPTDNMELRISISQLLHSYREGSSKHRLLSILMGFYDEKFTDWLRSNNHLGCCENNVELQSKIRVERFNLLVRRHLKISDESSAKFNEKVKKSLGFSDVLKPSPVSETASTNTTPCEVQTNATSHSAVVSIRKPVNNSNLRRISLHRVKARV